MCRATTIGIVSIAFTMATSVQAQGNASKPDSIQLATITTDTGDFAPGHRDFSRYNQFDLCAVATRNTLKSAQNTLEYQDYKKGLAHRGLDTIGVRSSVLVGRACAARFPLDTFTTHDGLGELLTLAITVRDDSLTQATLHRIITREPTHEREARRQVFDLLVDEFTRARIAGVDSVAGHPAPASLAQRLFEEINRSGSWEDRRTINHTVFYSGVDQDFQLQELAAERWLAWLHANPAPADTVWTARNGWAALQAYQDLMREAFFEHPDSMPVILRRAQQDTWVYNGGVYAPKTIPLQQMSAAQAMMVLSPLGTAWDATQRLRAIRMNHADFWFPKGADTVFPAPGKVTMYFGSEGCEYGGTFRQRADSIRRLLTQYGPQGLVIVITSAVEDTANFCGTTYNQNLEGPYTGAQMAERIRHFFQDEEHLPITVGVWIAHHEVFRPAPDGRRVNTDTVRIGWQEFYSDGAVKYGPGHLVGRDGTVINFNQSMSNLFYPSQHEDAILKWALRQPAVTLPTPNMMAVPAAPSSMAVDTGKKTTGSPSMAPAPGIPPRPRTNP